VPALLEDARVTVELIADGHHVDAALVRWVIATAGPARVAFVTDACAAAGMPDGRYRLGDVEVVQARGEVRAGNGSLAGSALTMDRVFRRLVTTHGVPIADASRMLSGTPAAAVGLDGAGALTPGSSADLVVLDDAFRVRHVMRRGEWIVGRPVTPG